jgi:hypothetical protein
MHTTVLSPPGDSAVDVDSLSQLLSVSPSPGLQTDTLLKRKTTLNLITKPIMIRTSEHYVCSFFTVMMGVRLCFCLTTAATGPTVHPPVRHE